MKRSLVILLLLVVSTVESMANGKMFRGDTIPPGIPYQRALILFKDGTQTLILQSKYALSEPGGGKTLGWVVPVPAVPEVASMSPDYARNLFWNLGSYSSRRIIRVGPMLSPILTVAGWVFLILSILSFLLLPVCLYSYANPFPARIKRNRGRLFRLSLGGLIVSIPMVVVLIIIPEFFITYRGGTRQAEVSILSEHRVGIYDVRVVGTDNAEDLIAWLDENEFSFGEEDTAAFESYVSRGWCFVVAIINPSEDQKPHEIASEREGLVAPLILRFPHDSPVYPLALTGTGNHDTEVLIYLAAKTKMSCENRMTLRFAGDLREGLLEPLTRNIDPEGFFVTDDMRYPFLTLFNKTLTPEEMSRDMIFAPARDKKPFRERVWTW